MSIGGGVYQVKRNTHSICYYYMSAPELKKTILDLQEEQGKAESLAEVSTIQIHIDLCARLLKEHE